MENQTLEVETVSKNTLKKRRQRANLKKDPERLAIVREREKKRVKEWREKKKEHLEKHPRLKAQEREKKRVSQAKFREKKKKEKESVETITEIESGRSKAATEREKRKEDRLRKKESELKKKEEQLRKRGEVQRVQKWRMKVNLLESSETQTLPNAHVSSPFSSPTTEKRAVKRTKTAMPKTPEKRARIVEKLVESPTCKSLLQQKGVIITKKAREEAQKNEKIVTTLKENLESLKPKGGMSTEQRRAYIGLKKIYNTKAKSRKGKKINKPNEKWWKLQRKTRKDTLSTAVRSSVHNFYLSAGISREVPDKKAVIKLKNGQKVQRHTMTMTLADAYSVYKSTYPDHKIGFTKFKQLRPLQVKRVRETARKTCLCPKCCNTALKTEALKKLVTRKNLSVSVELSKQKLVDMTLCSYETTKYPRRECIERVCTKCGPHLVSKIHYKEILELEDDIQWYKWESVTIEKNGQTKKVTSCVMKETSAKEFLEEYHKDLHGMSGHLFTAKWQHDMMKECIDAGKTTVVMDFAENYACKFQNEVQSGFFDQVQVVIHPMMIYYQKEATKFNYRHCR